MKSLYDISWQVSEEEYRADPAYSYSTLARFNREGFDNISHLFDKVESPSLLFGSLVDCILTGTKEEFGERFLVADFPEIPDSQKKITEYLFNTSKFSSDKANLNIRTMSSEFIISATEMLAFQLNWKPETRAKVIRENCKEYFDLLTLAEGKSVVSQRLFEDALSCADALKTAKATKFYFELDNPFNTDIERLYQLKFKGEYNGIPIRCMLDECLVDHKNKIIYPIDLKTSSKPEWKFYKSFIDWNYWIQAQLYAYILKQNILKDDYFKDFKIADYTFIVINRKTKTPLVWVFDKTFAINDIKVGNLILKNWRNILTELNFYLKGNSDVPIEILKDTTNNIFEWIKKEYDNQSN